MTYTYKMLAPFATFVLFVGLLLTGAQSASAQQTFEAPGAERPPGVDVRPVPIKALKERAQDRRMETKEKIDAMQDKRDAFRDRAIEKRDEFREEVRDARSEARDNADARRDEIKAELDAAETPEERQAILDAARAERDAMREAALEKREEFRDRARDLRADLKEKREEFRSEIKTEAGERIKGHLEKVLDRIGGALERFTGLLERINNKIAELEANGIDTTDVVEASTLAERAISAAADQLTTARATFERALESENPREHLDEVKAAVRSATEAIKDAHRALTAAVKELKELIRSTHDDSDSDSDDSENDE